MVGVGSGVLSGMFGIGGAVASTPAIRVLGATPLEAVGSTIPSILPSAISGGFRYRREQLVQWRIVTWIRRAAGSQRWWGRGSPPRVPGDGHRS